MPGDIRLNIILDEHGSIKKIEAVDKSIKNLKNSAGSAGTETQKFSLHLLRTASVSDLANRALKDIGKSVFDMAKLFGPGALAIAGIYGAFRLLSDSISLASAASEEHSKLMTVFNEQTDKTAAVVKGLSENYGLSTMQSEKMLAATGNLLTSLGITQEEALSLSEQTQKLAVDLTSFTNYAGGAEGASDALTKAMLGEREMAKGLGLAIGEADVTQRLLEKGQQNLSGSALRAAKAQATLEIAMKLSKNAMGDYERTQGSFANQSRKLEATMEDLKVGIGQALMEALLPALQDFSAWVSENKDSIIGFFEGLAAAIKGVSAAVSGITGMGAKVMMAVNDVGESVENLGKKELAMTVQSGKMNAGIQDMIDQLEKRSKKETEVTKVVEKSATVLTEVDRIAKKYNISTQSATEILNKMKPNLAQAAELQKKLGISEAESIRVVGILNGLETKKKTTIDEQNIVIPELVANLDGLNEITDSLSKNEEDLGRVIDAGPTQAYYGLGSEINNTNEFLKENEDRTKAAAEAAKETEAAINGLTGMLDIMSSMADTPDELAIGFQALSGIIQNIASGNVVGAAIAGIGGLLSIITGKTKEAKSALDEYNETINALNEAMGITYDELIRGQDALDGWVEKLLSGASLMEILGDKYDDFLKFLDRANMSLEEFMQKMKDDAVAAQAENLEKLRQTTEFYAKTVDEMLPSLENFLKVPAQNVEDFNSQVTITMSTFANLLKSGIPITEALDKMGTAFDSLIASQDKLGITGDATFQSLMKFRDLVSANKDLVNSVTGLNDVLAATAQMGALDQKTFDAFSKSAQSQFDQLTKAGFSASQAYQMLGPGLYELKKQIDLGTVSVDDNTKKLIANAEAAGAFEGMADPMDRVASILGEIYLLLGGTEEKLDSLGVTGQASAAATASEFDKATVSIYDMSGELQNADNAMSAMADTTGAAGKEMISVMDEFAEKGSESVMTMAEAADQTAQDMKDSFSEMSRDGVEKVAAMVQQSTAMLEKLGDMDLKLNIGGEIPPKGNTPTPPKKNFAMGTPDYGFVVPTGYPNDSYRVGLTSGERVTVSKSGDVNTKSETVLNQAVYINNPVLSSGALAMMLTDALQQNKYNIATVVKKVAGNG